MPTIDVGSMLTTSQVAQALGVSVRTIDRLRVGGYITSYKLFRRYRYDLEEVKAALAAYQKRSEKK